MVSSSLSCTCCWACINFFNTSSCACRWVFIMSQFSFRWRSIISDHCLVCSMTTCFTPGSLTTSLSLRVEKMIESHKRALFDSTYFPLDFTSFSMAEHCVFCTMDLSFCCLFRKLSSSFPCFLVNFTKLFSFFTFSGVIGSNLISSGKHKAYQNFRNAILLAFYFKKIYLAPLLFWWSPQE